MTDLGGIARLDAAEIRRKAVHVGCGLIALTFRWLTWEQALVLALGALAFNVVVLPFIGGGSMLRPTDRKRGFAPGILLYPASVAIVVVAFGPRDMTVPAMAWALLAFGDGAAGIAGLRWGRRRLPWNAGKTWEGLAAHAICGAAAATGIGAFVSAGSAMPMSLPAVAFAALVGATVTALVESMKTGVDDNLTVPILGGLVVNIALVLVAAGPRLDAPGALPLAVASGLLGALAWWRGMLTVPGAIAAALMGALVFAWGGAGSFATLCAFFALGVGATRLGRRLKEARGIAEGRCGRRGFGNVLANGGMALACAFFAAHGGFSGADLTGLAAGSLVALVAALATASFDTVSSEVGKAYGRVTVLITSLRRVPPGTEGAVSLEGTLAGLLASALVGTFGIVWLLGPGALALVPLVNFIFWFIPGTDGENEYGMKTPPNGVGVTILAMIMPVVFITGILSAIALPAYSDYVKRAQIASASAKR